MSVSLLRPDFQFMIAPSLENIELEEWQAIQRQRAIYHQELSAQQVLSMLRVGQNLPTYGYYLNNFQHCLQTATMMAEAGYGDEDLVVGLLHDISFVVAPEEHGLVAARLLRRVVSERNQWMLEHHAIVGEKFLPGDRGEWRELEGSPHFAWTEEFVERFDLRAIDPRRPILPLEDFEPIVYKVFAERLAVPSAESQAPPKQGASASQMERS